MPLSAIIYGHALAPVFVGVVAAGRHIPRGELICDKNKVLSHASNRVHTFRILSPMRYVLSAFWIVLYAWTADAGVVPYVGAIGGIATLSADAGSRATAQSLALSGYSPSNGGALNVFAGLHLHNYVSVQGDYMWNENELELSSTSSASNTFYRQRRNSSQQAAVFDFLVYFRPRQSRIRPYLATGVGWMHLVSREEALLGSHGNPILPPDRFSANRAVFRSHVGIDLRIYRRLYFRYSFSESISNNDISQHLSPPAPRRLANFQNLFRFVVRF